VLPDDAPNHNSHILIEFFMPSCRFCKEFKEDWNKIAQESYARYNVDENAPKRVEFYLVNGIKEIELRRRYKIKGFPDFIYLRPGTRGKEAISYD
jgi:thioredoxin-related protein